MQSLVASFRRSAINFAAMSHAVNAHHSDDIGNFVDDTVVTHSNSPIAVGSSKFPATSWARIFREALNRRYHPIMRGGGESAEVFLGGAFEEDAIHDYLPLRLAK
jgi:hypothetical protein